MKDFFENEIQESVYALAWKQPFASMMLHGKLETRRWMTHVRGRVLICSTQTKASAFEMFQWSTPEQIQRINEILVGDPSAELLGHAIAVGELAECRRMCRRDEEESYVRYHSDLWVHKFEDVRRIVPFQIKCGQKWRRLDDPANAKYLNSIQYVD